MSCLIVVVSCSLLMVMSVVLMVVGVSSTSVVLVVVAGCCSGGRSLPWVVATSHQVPTTSLMALASPTSATSRVTTMACKNVTEMLKTGGSCSGYITGKPRHRPSSCVPVDVARALACTWRNYFDSVADLSL